MRELTKDVEVSGRKFQIRKFDALTGSFIALKVVGLLAPAFKGMKIPEIDGKEIKTDMDAQNKAMESFNMTEAFMPVLMGMKRSDFSDIQTDCLKACSEYMPGGLNPVMHANGSWGAIGIETDVMLAITLTVHALMFNLSGFFGESLSGSGSMGAILGSFLPGAKM